MDRQDDTPRSLLRARSPLGLLLLGAGLLVLLGLVAAVSRAHHTPGGHAGIHQPPAGVGDYLFTFFAIVVSAGFLVLLYLWFSERDLLAQAHQARRRKGMHKAFFILFLLLAVVLLAFRLHLFSGNKFLRPHIQPPAVGANAKKKLRPTKTARPPKFELLPIAVATAAGLVVLGFIGVRTMKRSRNELAERFVLEQQFESLLDDTLDDLYANTDLRAAIVAAYARMEMLFAARGLARDPAETSMEYLGRAVGELRASGAALGRLTGLFQWAKFSTHEVDRPMRDEAIQALTEVRDELRAHRQEEHLRRAEAERIAEAVGEKRSAAESDRVYGEDPFAAAAEKMRGDVYTGGRGG